LKYLAGYPEALVAQLARLMEQGRLGSVLAERYPIAHEVRTDAALYHYVAGLKATFLRKAPPLSRVIYDHRLHLVRQALGTHTAISRVQGGKLKAKREIRIAGLCRDLPEELLRMVAVHELAHLKEPEHDKAFYRLCLHMEPDYHRSELDLRAYLCHLDGGGPALWPAHRAAPPVDPEAPG
jgi:predicted metal-dependent hydrolase